MSLRCILPLASPILHKVPALSSTLVQRQRATWVVPRRWNWKTFTESQNAEDFANDPMIKKEGQDVSFGYIEQQKGLKCYEAGDYEQAIVHFQKAKDSNEKSVATNHHMGVAYLRLDRLVEAISCFNKALDHGVDVSTYASKGQALYQLGEYMDAYDCLGLGIDFASEQEDADQQAEEDNVIKDYTKTVAETEGGEEAANDPAVQRLDEIPRAENVLETLYAYRGYAAFDLQEFEEARRCFAKALELSPSDGYYSYRLALVSQELKDYDAALELYNKALELDPFSVEYHLARGDLYFVQEKYEKALVDFDASARLNSKNLLSYNYVGLCHYELKDYEQAEAVFARGMKLADDMPPELTHGLIGMLLHNQALNFAKLGKMEEAIAGLERAKILEPHEPEHQTQLNILIEPARVEE